MEGLGGTRCPRSDRLGYDTLRRSRGLHSSVGSFLNIVKHVVEGGTGTLLTVLFLRSVLSAGRRAASVKSPL